MKKEEFVQLIVDMVLDEIENDIVESIKAKETIYVDYVEVFNQVKKLIGWDNIGIDVPDLVNGIQKRNREKHSDLNILINVMIGFKCFKVWYFSEK